MIAASPVRHAETVFFLGESHALSFAERVVEREGAPPLMCQALFVANGVSYATITNPDGSLNAQVRRLLRANRLIVEPPQNESGLLQSAAPIWQYAARMLFSRPPMIVLTLGSYDIFRAIVEFPGDDFHLPSHVPLHPLAPSLLPHALPGAVSIDHAATWAMGYVTPLQNALQRLRELGFERLGLLSAMPPPPDEALTKEVVAQLGGDPNTPRTRTAFSYKTALFLNGLMAHVCAVERVQYLDAWPLLTSDGIQISELFSGNIHLNDRGVDEVLTRLVVPASLHDAALNDAGTPTR